MPKPAASDRSLPQDLDLFAVPAPCFVVDERLLARNLTVMAQIMDRCQSFGADVRIMLALKGFAMWSTFPLMRRTLRGCCASSPHEARLAREEFAAGRLDWEVHAFAAGYSEADVRELAGLADHMVFNSFGQWQRLGPLARQEAWRLGRSLEFGLRVNPEHSEGHTPIYDPCSPGSRLGIRRREFRPELLADISGLHFHTLCEHNADALARTLPVFERNFGEFLAGMRWLNLGGGHHISRPDYDVDLLVELLRGLHQRHPHLTLYLEPGEAVALDAGVLVAEVLDVIQADMPVVILNASAAAHMPDVLEMPYRPRAALEGRNAADPGEGWTCRLAGHSCLAGDVIGEYGFHRPLRVGDRLAFMDMAIYSMVKTTTFNGLRLPAIARIDESGTLRLEREFGYQDFKGRLA